MGRPPILPSVPQGRQTGNGNLDTEFIIPSIGQKCNPSGRILHGDPWGLFHPVARRFCAGKAAAFVARCTPSRNGKIIHNLAEIAVGFAVLALMRAFD
jgi:hypothetical protein